MAVIDDEGNLFGVVNVVDALVVLGVLAVVAAGVAFINPFANPDEATRYATMELDEQPSYVAERISAGDVMSPAGTSRNLTVTDVYRTPGPGENVSTTVRVRVNGTLRDRPQQPGTEFRYAGTTLTPGNQFTISTGEYQASGRIISLDETGETLAVASTRVRFAGTVSTATAEAIEPGDTYQAGGADIATIESVHVAPGNNQDTSRVVIGATIETLTRNEVLFAGQPVTLGRSLTFQNGAYQLTGEITAVGNATIQTTTTRVVAETTVATTTAETISPGDTYQLAGNNLATIEAVTTYPTESANQKRVLLGLTLDTTVRNGNDQFGTIPVTVGTSIPFSTSNYQLSASIQAKGTTTLAGTTSTRTVVVQLETVSPELAENLEAGLTERRRGMTTATVQDVRVEPAVISLTSESGDIFRRQHPVKKDVYLTVDLAVRDTDTSLQFHGRPLQENRPIILDFRTITINGQVIDITPATTAN